MFWQQVVNASKDMLGVANSVFRNKGRSEAFTRKITIEETAAL